MIVAALEGPRLEPASSGPARQLVVILHGYGADGQDLVPLAEAWRAALPDAAFLIPDAPQPCGEFPTGRQWFPLTFRDPAEIARGLAAVKPHLNRFLDDEMKARNLEAKALALVGFSQGAMLALDVGLSRTEMIAGIVSFSGLLAEPPVRGRQSYPPVLLAHGSEDSVIPPVAMGAAERGLEAAGVAVEAHLRPGLGHGIDAEEVAFGARFLAAALP